ncbi:MAG: NUDIX domain-containing protein [Lachnospiraceae bacterium]|nr:NUDIX domain-containing protein [Lachnospiraceae bacterium]
MIVKDHKGNELLDVFFVDEETAQQKHTPVTHALVVVKVGEEYLMGWNRWRQCWEIFGGCIEEGESLRQCIVREGYEELGLENVEYQYLGLMYYHMAPGYFNPQWHEEYGALYGVTIQETMMEAITRKRSDKEEIEKLAFYSQITGESIAAIDEKLLEFWK